MLAACTLLMGVFPQTSPGQSMTVLPAFDPRIPANDSEGYPMGMNTYVDAVSADGKTIVGHAEEFDHVYTYYDPIYQEDISVVVTNTITFKWHNGVFTKLPFHYPDYDYEPNPKLLGISADGSRIYGVADEDAIYQENPPVTVLDADGGQTPGTFGEWVEFIPGLRGRTTPTGGWIGESTLQDNTITVRAVSTDFGTFVGSTRSAPDYNEVATIWTAEGAISIPPTSGFEDSVATSVSADGRVVCGYFLERIDEDDDFTGDAGFVWTKGTGAILIRDMVRDEGPPFDDNFPNINPLSVSGDGGTIIGTTDGVDTSGRFFAFRQILGPSVTINIPKQSFSVGEPIEVEVSVFSPTEQPQTITFTDGILTSPDGKCDLEFAEEDLPPPTFTLTPDDPIRTFTVTVTPVEYGTLKLSTAATAVSSKGTVNLSAEEEFHITPLKVSVRMKPVVGGKPILNVELDDEGNVIDTEGNPVTPKVEVTVENLGNTPVIGAIQGVDPRARDRSAALGRISTEGSFPIDFNPIIKGVPFIREIDLQINEDGRFDFVALVTAREEGGTHGFTARARGAPLAVGEPYPVKLELKMVRTADVTNQNNGAIFVKPGSQIQFLANVENLTTNSTIKYYGINAEKNLNVQGGRLTSDEGIAVDPPFPHDHELDAGSTDVLSGLVKTDKEGAPSGTLTWVGLEDIVQVDDATGVETELTMDDVLVESTDTGWLGNDLSLRVIQDNSIDFPPPSLDILEEGAYFSYGAALSFGAWAYDTVDAVGGIGRLAGNVIGNPSVLADTWGEGSRAVWEMGEYANRTWQGMTNEQKAEFALTVGQESLRRFALFSSSRVPFDPNDVEAGMTYARNATYGFFGNVESAYASNDPAQISQVLGQVSGRTTLEVVTALMPSPKFQEYSKGAEALLMATNLNDAQLITHQETLLRTLKTGLVDSLTARRAWGVGGQNLENIQSVFAHFKVKGYLRERSPRAFNLIDEWAEAVWKPEMMKPKGFSEIDSLIVEDPSLLPKVVGKNNQELGLDGITVIFLPEADDIIAHRARTRLIAQGSYPLEDIEEAVQACLARARQRREEFAKYAPEFEKWAADTVVNGGGIPVARNYADNGVPDPAEFKDAKRGFEFQRHDLPNGNPMYIPKMKNTAGQFRFISGDIDWIHFTFLDGSPLDAKTARCLYDAMFRCCGLQHPETISWILHKQTVFKSKINQIGEYLTGQKALLEVTGQSTRAVHMNKNLTRFAKEGRKHLIFFDGGIKARTRATIADAETSLALFQQRYPNNYSLLPFLRNSKFNEALNQAGADDGSWTYTTAENDSLILRENEKGEFQRYDGSKWVPWMPGSPAGRAARSPKSVVTVHLAPTSSLTESAPSGSTMISVADLPAQWQTELAGHVTNWFTAGQTIVIAPGELTQEVHTISAMAPMTLTQPLRYNHPTNTLVAVVPAGMTIPEVSATASPLVSTIIDTLRGTVTMVWQSLPGRRYVLESASSADPGNWSEVLPQASASEKVLRLEIPLSEYNDDNSYRLRDVGDGSTTPALKIISFTLDPVAGEMILRWESTPGHTYQVEYSDNLTDEIWRTIDPPITASGTVTTLPMSYDPEVKRRFFRVR